MIKALQGYQLKEGEPNFILGVAGNGLSTTVQKEIYDGSPARLIYINYINLLSSEEPHVLLEIVNQILACLQLESLKEEDIDDFHKLFNIFKEFASHLAAEKVQGQQVTLIIDEFQNFKSYSNAFFFTLDKILGITSHYPGLTLTTVLISDSYINPKSSESTAGVSKLFLHYLNLHFVSNYTLQDMEQGFIAQRFNKLADEEKNLIYNFSGGIPGIFVTLIDAVESGVQTADFLTNLDIEWKANDLWDSLGPENQGILKSFVKKHTVKFANQIQQKYLVETGILDLEEHEIRPKLLKEYIEKEIALENQASLDMELHFPGFVVDITDLSPQQADVMRLLHLNQNKLVGRDQIAQLLWEEDYLDKYSDYAIDKLMSQLRILLRKKAGYNILQTVRGKGYLIKPERW